MPTINLETFTTIDLSLDEIVEDTHTCAARGTGRVKIDSLTIWAVDEADAMKPYDLKLALLERGQSTFGSKKALFSRLLSFVADDAARRTSPLQSNEHLTWRYIALHWYRQRCAICQKFVEENWEAVALPHQQAHGFPRTAIVTCPPLPLDYARSEADLFSTTHQQQMKAYLLALLCAALLSSSIRGEPHTKDYQLSVNYGGYCDVHLQNGETEFVSLESVVHEPSIQAITSWYGGDDVRAEFSNPVDMPFSMSGNVHVKRPHASIDLLLEALQRPARAQYTFCCSTVIKFALEAGAADASLKLLEWELGLSCEYTVCNTITLEVRDSNSGIVASNLNAKSK
ncbi:hypothetical protein E5Q_01900 [Mixia osmundae IAM 14324]|uniref:SAP domain-containing protein n=1 Tax=Mixia osmundae (strain CBS 9802 / IAM 14324 / JCM 22182 / KY 12970) TaxID=764103 RepID=G7DXD4_MIXOS|nr:hypothetical protein E5Q_01900 [Mixia osmundae IAM 14324]